MVIITPFLLALATVQLRIVEAHTLFSKLFVDGQDQGNGTCLRMPLDPGTATNPIAALSSNDMACGRNGSIGVARVCPAFSGSVLTFEYRDVPDDASKGSIDISHKGPCAVYMKKTSSAISDTAVGGGWFKVWEEGYDEAARKWCTEKIIDNDGHMSIVIPSALEAGYYLIRPELLALHQTDKTPQILSSMWAVLSCSCRLLAMQRRRIQSRYQDM
ncbi:hypothetical protein H2203_000780 [Taxawa tesnikishii (nom. ined.)]|nr:hypothetical protein H2203_000780 [Dothideales sp. JES 119]